MAKLVIQNQGMTGRVCELHMDRTTVGRVEDNTFQISDPSVSSHHCEVHLRGSEIFIRDLNSTNGTFIGDARITESVLKPGQTLKLGQVELKLEAEGAAAAATASPAAPAPAKKSVDSTLVIPRGVSLGDLESGGRPPGFESSTVFSKKKNKANTYFLIGAIVLVLVIVVLLIYALSQVKSGGHP
jgi:pSer/pThr/pTyr-binding forkhead associated (FHA) protein